MTTSTNAYLAPDPTFQATQDIAFNQKVIASSEATVQACETELLALKDIDAGTASWWGSKRAVEMRENYLLKKMRAADYSAVSHTRIERPWKKFETQGETRVLSGSYKYTCVSDVFVPLAFEFSPKGAPSQERD